MRKVLVLIPVLVLLLAFAFGAVSTANATPPCWLQEFPGYTCFWECCKIQGQIICEMTHICWA